MKVTRSDDVDDDGEEESGWNGNNDLGTSTLTQSATESKKKDLEKGIFQNKSSSETNWQ